jgi:hypothetical protein
MKYSVNLHVVETFNLLLLSQAIHEKSHDQSPRLLLFHSKGTLTDPPHRCKPGTCEVFARGNF